MKGIGGSATFDAIATGELAGSLSAVQMPDIACAMVAFKAVGSNAGNVYIGASGVTTPDGATDETTGWELAAGEETPWLPVVNLNVFFRICDNAGDDLVYTAMLLE